MSRRIPNPLRRFSHPRSERAGLWACVYCGAVEDRSADGDASVGTRRAD